MPPRRKKIDWNARIDWFDDWRDWFGPKAYGIGCEPKTWKGVAVTVFAISVLVVAVVAVMYRFA